MRLLENTFKPPQAAGLTLKPSKAQFGPAEAKHLSHVNTPEKSKIGSDRVEEIVERPTPTSVEELRGVLGMTNFVYKYIPDYVEVVESLATLTRKDVALARSFHEYWGDEQTAAFLKTKHLRTSAPFLHFLDFSEEFVDASETGAGGFLA